MFETLEHILQGIFLRCLGKGFFEPETTFVRPRSPKESRKDAKMEAQATLEALSGKCEKHGRGDVFKTLGDLGESPGGDFFQSGSPAPFWKDPGEHFG